MLVAVCLLTAVTGLAIGSFLNVVIWRVPRGESIVRPASRCPRCGETLRHRDNVPVLGYLLLRGRCRGCRGPVSVRYPVVELVTAALFVAVTLRLGLSWELPAYLYLVAVGVALAAIDIDVHRLPDVIVLPSYVVSLALLGLAAWGDHDLVALERAVAGMACLYLLYLLLRLAHPRGMGRGDLKLAGVLGLYLGWLGWDAVAVGAFLGFFLGGVMGVSLIVAGRANGKSALPFGPFMLVGALVAVFLAQPLGDIYLHAAFG